MGMRAISLGLAVLLLSAAPAAAQYFGRNKVQYEAFDFQVLRTPHFDIHYYPAEREAADRVGRMAERWYARLSRTFDQSLTGRTPIILYASHPDFAQTTILNSMLDEGVGGFTDHQKGRVVLPLSPGLRETDHVLGHELVHAFQRDILQRHRSALALEPLWFAEGMAEFFTTGTIDANTAMWMRDAVRRGPLPSIRQLSDPRWFPYRYGQALWAFLAKRFGSDIAARALIAKTRRPGVGRLSAVTGLDEATLTREWHAALRAEFGASEDGESPAAEKSEERPDRLKALIGPAGGGRLNIGPALSPDGTELVFLSERGRYSIDVFLADAATGEVKRKLIGTAADPHFESLQFIDSVGAWDPAGERFALAARHNGHPVLTILDMPSGKVLRERSFTEFDQIFDPSWSPNGRQIVFSALHRGTSDLAIFDLDTNTVRVITADTFADLQPAWAPDGATIAFVTDRFSSSIDALTFGQYRLATIDVASRAIRELPCIANAKNIDPQWAGNDTLYFLADPAGTSNVFRLTISTAAIDQITDEPIGVSGVSALSPALAVAPHSDRLAFSTFTNGAYEIRTMRTDTGRVYSGPVVVPSGTALEAKSVSPIASSTYQTAPYRAGLKFDQIGQPYVSAGGGALGSVFRAGVSLSFSDLLERHQLETAVQAGTKAVDFATQIAYIDRTSRWTWGVIGAQLPLVFGSSRLVTPESDAQTPDFTQETVWLRQTHRQVMAAASYPFSRVQRVEVSGAVHNISYAREVRTRLYSGPSAALVDDQTVQTPAARAVTLIETSAALVYDSSVHGATAPILGRRSRLEITPTFGTMSFVTVSADYRRYMMPVRPLTIAARMYYVGRYGAHAADPRLLPLVWTLRQHVRGYTLRDATSRPCDVMECASISDLGTRQLLVGNIELRFPIMGTFGLLGRSTALPIDGLLFADAAGVSSTPSWNPASSARTALRTAGAGVRLNAGGFVFELVAARPFDRPAAGWTIVANFRPGF